MKELISPAKASEAIDKYLLRFPTIHCPIDECAGRILRESVYADRSFPPFDRAMMDGYALRAEDLQTNTLFAVTGRINAGNAPQALGQSSHKCIEIMTGAVVPPDVDCIVPVENVEIANEGKIRINQPDTIHSGDFIHKAGSDREAGAQLLSPGRVLGSREISVAASCGYEGIKVSKLPTIGLVGTGDELVDIGQKPAPHQIRRSNALALQSALTRKHLPTYSSIHLRDDLDETRQKLETALKENDILLISGGISMGKKDFIPQALDALRLECHFHGVQQQPGKPFGFWTHDDGAVFTLPGNPISALVCLHHYALPAIERAMGRANQPKPVSLPLETPAALHSTRTRFLPVQILSGNRLRPRPIQNSGDLVRILESDGYIVIPPGNEKQTADGTEFAFHPWF
ncbi:MAG: molybdopterin molybdotransferase MoeA [Coraliomargaritaceae bacterium]